MTPVALRPLALETAADLQAGRRPETGPRWHPEYPTADTLIGLEFLIAAQLAGGWSGTEVPRWWTYQILAATGSGDLVIGDIGFHGPPAQDGPRRVEFGYAVVPAWWNRGVATAACTLLLAIAARDGADLVTAEADPANAASVRVLTKAGLTFDPVGKLWVSECRELPAATHPLVDRAGRTR